MAGCGSSGSGTTTAGGRAIQAPVQSRGTKGENPTAEAAGTARLSAVDCKSLATIAERQTGTALRRRATPTPPLSRCRLTGPGTQVNVFLDTGFAANRRYHNRIEETVQFNGQNPTGLPQPVPHVGEKAAYNSAASWIPALHSLLAVRGNRWLTVTISVAGRADRRLLAQAAVLARAGFKLTAGG
ncbi:MAG TPA: hypothetical protein VN522_05025 [Solirubrobacterales bacterium]|nr:hypothetical protein [Solirubrobacterales bacterium]